MEYCYTINETIKLAVKAIPGSSKSGITGVSGGRLRIKIAAAPEHNKANDELKSFLADVLGCAKKEVAIPAGEKSRMKTVSLPLHVRDKLDLLILECGGTE